MSLLLYPSVGCSACGSSHDLYVNLAEAARPQVTCLRFACPDSGEIVGARLRGAAARPDHIEANWIECAPVYSQKLCAKN